jgi:hypothetical protein
MVSAKLTIGFAHRDSGENPGERHGEISAPWCEQLVTQLLGLGNEKHDDAMDALVYLILRLAGDGINPQDLHYA